jgi:hypothetical protein
MAPDSILQELRRRTPPELSLEALCVGLHWTVATTARGAGVGAAFRDQDFGLEARDVPGAGTLVGQPVVEVAQACLGAGLAARSAAVAMLAAALPADPAALPVNAKELLVGYGAKGARVVMVGHFLMVDWLREANLDLRVFELPGRLQPGDLPSTELSAHLPSADVLAITATTLITGTLEDILARRAPHTKVILMGPTTPLSPLLFDYGIHHVCGVRVEQPDVALACAAQGATARQMQGLRRLCLSAPGEGLL